MSSGSIKGIGDGIDPGGDPYSNDGAQVAINKLIRDIFTALKEGKDVSAMMNNLMYKMQTFGSNVVGQDSEAEKQMTKYLSGVAGIQSIVNNQSGASVQDVDMYSGKPLVDAKGNPVYVSPMQKLKDQIAYLVNDPSTKYKMQIGPDGKGEYTTNPPTINPSYTFFLKHPDVLTSMTTNINSFLSALKNPPPDASSPSIKPGSVPGYNNGSSGVELDDFTLGTPSSGPPYDAKTTWTGNAIDYMWQQNNLPDDPTKGTKPDPAILTAVMSAVGSINQSYTSASSAVQTVAQSNIQNFNAEQGNLNKFLQAMIAVEKSFVQGQKTS